MGGTSPCPSEAAAGRFVRARERRADHHRVGAAGDRLRDVAARPHAAIGDDLHVLPGLEHVRRPRARDVGDRRRLRHAEAEDAARRARRAGADADEHARRAGAHEVQAGLVGGAAARDDRDRKLGDELLEVQRRRGLRHVLGRHDGALDHEDVEAGVERELVVARDPLRRQRRRDDDPRLLLDLLDPPGDQLGLDRLLVDRLHLARRDLLGELRDALELGVRVLEARPDALEVQYRQAAELADDPCGVGRDHAVHRRGEQRQLEAVRAERPRDVDVVGIAGAPGRHDRDVVESIRAAGLLPATDLDLHHNILGSLADEKTPRGGGVEETARNFAVAAATTARATIAAGPRRNGAGSVPLVDDRRRIVAMGGGGFSMEPDNPLLDDFVLSLARREAARIAFVATAGGDAAPYVADFYRAFAARGCQPSDVGLFDRRIADLRAHVLAQDVVYVGGGNTASLLAVWRAHGLDRVLTEAWHAGVVLAGISAGMNCWFDQSVTDSFGPDELAPLDDGLGLVAGSACPPSTAGRSATRPTCAWSPRASCATAGPPTRAPRSCSPASSCSRSSPRGPTRRRTGWSAPPTASTSAASRRATSALSRRPPAGRGARSRSRRAAARLRAHR